MKTIAAVPGAVMLMACASSSFAAGDAWKSYPNGVMHKEIVCPAGLQKMVTAATSLDLFSGLWAPQPEPQSKNEIEWPAFHDHERLHNVTGESGKVMVELLIGKQGQVVAAHVTCSSNPALDQMVLQAAESAEYRPAKIAGSPILSVIKRPFNFAR